MPAASEVKKIDPNWESKVTDISVMNLGGDLEQIDREILSCNEAVTDAGLGGISYCTSHRSEIQNQVNAIGTMEQYVMGIRSALQQQLDDPLFDGFNKKATETLSRIHPEKFQTSNTLGLTVTLGASGHGESYSSKQNKDYLDLYDFLGYTVGNYSEYGCLHTESMECVQDFADMFKADYDAASKSGALKGSNVKCLDDYLKNLVNGGDFSHQMDQPFKSFLSGLLDITIVKPIIDACTGYDCITGEDLSDTDRTMDMIFAGVSLIPFAGVAGKAIEIGGKEGALFLGKRVAVDCISYAAAYSAGQLAQQKGLDPRINVLLSLGIGIVATKVAGKYILKDAKGAVIGEIHDNSATEAIKALKFNSWDDFKLYIQKIGKDTSLTNEDKVWCMQQAFNEVADKTDICIPSDVKYIKGFTADGKIIYDWPKDFGFDKTTVSSISRNNRLPGKWDRYGPLSGSNFADVPSSGRYSSSERSIPYVENEAAYHCGKFNNATYFDKIDAIKEGNLAALNKILKSEGVSEWNTSKFEVLRETYNDFIAKAAKEMGTSVDATYGIKGKAAAWKGLKGGAEQITTPFGGGDLRELGIII